MSASRLMPTNSISPVSMGYTPPQTKILLQGAILIDRVFTGRQELRLEKPLAISIDYRDGIYIMENLEFDIVCVSPEYDKCIREFYDDFLFIWKEYGLEEDTNLTKGAKLLKDKVLQYLKQGATS